MSGMGQRQSVSHPGAGLALGSMGRIKTVGSGVSWTWLQNLISAEMSPGAKGHSLPLTLPKKERRYGGGKGTVRTVEKARVLSGSRRGKGRDAPRSEERRLPGPRRRDSSGPEPRWQPGSEKTAGDSWRHRELSVPRTCTQGQGASCMAAAGTGLDTPR